MNAIIEDLTKTKFNYCHVLEVTDVEELKCILDEVISSFEESYEWEQISDFINTLTIYCLEDENEEEVYNFDISEYINQYN